MFRSVNLVGSGKSSLLSRLRRVFTSGAGGRQSVLNTDPGLAGLPPVEGRGGLRLTGASSSSSLLDDRQQGTSDSGHTQSGSSSSSGANGATGGSSGGHGSDQTDAAPRRGQKAGKSGAGSTATGGGGGPVRPHGSDQTDAAPRRGQKAGKSGAGSTATGGGGGTVRPQASSGDTVDGANTSNNSNSRGGNRRRMPGPPNCPPPPPPGAPPPPPPPGPPPPPPPQGGQQPGAHLHQVVFSPPWIGQASSEPVDTKKPQASRDLCFASGVRGPQQSQSSSEPVQQVQSQQSGEPVRQPNPNGQTPPDQNAPQAHPPVTARPWPFRRGGTLLIRTPDIVVFANWKEHIFNPGRVGDSSDGKKGKK